MNMLWCKNIKGNYQIVRQLGLENTEFYFNLLPMDVEWMLDKWKTSGYEVGIFDLTEKVTIYKSEKFKGHEDFQNAIST